MKTQKRLTLREKLVAELHRTEAARASDPLPDTAVEYRFQQWSEALRNVVAARLDVNGWGVDDWSNNPMCNDARTFSFHYNGRVEPLLGRPMFVSTRMQIHTGRDLEAELARLSEEARWYRDRTNRMYGETQMAQETRQS